MASEFSHDLRSVIANVCGQSNNDSTEQRTLALLLVIATVFCITLHDSFLGLTFNVIFPPAKTKNLGR